MLCNKLPPKSEELNTTKAYLPLTLHLHCGLIGISVSQGLTSNRERHLSPGIVQLWWLAKQVEVCRAGRKGISQQAETLLA